MLFLSAKIVEASETPTRLSDADRLDAIGAVRVLELSYGSRKGRYS